MGRKGSLFSFKFINLKIKITKKLTQNYVANTATASKICQKCTDFKYMEAG
jgi:hypothetical protein